MFILLFLQDATDQTRECFCYGDRRCWLTLLSAFSGITSKTEKSSWFQEGERRLHSVLVSALQWRPGARHAREQDAGEPRLVHAPFRESRSCRRGSYQAAAFSCAFHRWSEGDRITRANRTRLTSCGRWRSRYRGGPLGTSAQIQLFRCFAYRVQGRVKHFLSFLFTVEKAGAVAPQVPARGGGV